MSKRPTLAEQLAQIAEPAPQDFDPEDSYATYGNERSEAAAEDLDAGRAEYLAVGASKLRKKGEAVYDKKYEGKKGSRRELYGDDQSDEEMSEEELEGEASAFPPSDEEEQDDDDEEDDEEEEAPALVVKPKKSSSRKASTTTTEQDEKAMMKQLKQAASADVEKGRDVKKQLTFCDNLLESRIKVQKAATAINALPRTSTAAPYMAALPDEFALALAAVQALSEELFGLRTDLMKNEQMEVPAGLGAARKRKRVAGGPPFLTASLADLATLEASLEPYLRTTVTKWSDKVLSASGLSISSSKKFKAVNQNAMHAIDHSLGAGERERLVKRTRTKRSVVGVVGESGLGRGGLEGEKQVDEECFDDGDFYQQMLRDVVESRMLDIDDPTLASLRLASARGKKQKQVVETRASKGRKIRYHVHEKVQNFMIPIEAGTFHEEQIDELFASLLGRSFPTVQDEEDEQNETGTGAASGAAVDVGQLRIFG